jgi:hypothetical protein
MHRLTPVNAVLAGALARVMPRGEGKVDWLDVADEFVLATAHTLTILDKKDYDRWDGELRRAKEYLRALGVQMP